MFSRTNLTPVEAAPKAFGAANLQPPQATRLREPSSWQARLPLQCPRLRGIGGFALKQRGRCRGFTLAELLVSVGVLVLLVLLATQLLNSAATITTLGHKQMDADSQARQLMDRMAIDFAQMVKRSDVDYYVKSSRFATASPTPAPGCTTACSNVYSTGVRTLFQPGNDRIAFYSAVPGYYPPTGSQSPLSLVAYRVNSVSGTTAFNKLERMGKGLVWNAVLTSQTPVVFMPIPLASPLPTPELPDPTPNPLPTPAWLEIAGTPSWSDSEVMGSQGFLLGFSWALVGICWDLVGSEDGRLMFGISHLPGSLRDLFFSLGYRDWRGEIQKRRRKRLRHTDATAVARLVA